MTTTPDDPTTALPGRSPVVDLATWQAERRPSATYRRILLAAPRVTA